MHGTSRILQEDTVRAEEKKGISYVNTRELHHSCSVFHCNCDSRSLQLQLDKRLQMVDSDAIECDIRWFRCRSILSRSLEKWHWQVVLIRGIGRVDDLGCDSHRGRVHFPCGWIRLYVNHPLHSRSGYGDLYSDFEFVIKMQ
jgi:hypothetical protein